MHHKALITNNKIFRYIMKYEKPELEEIELMLEGSFLGDNSEGVGIKPGEGDGDDWD